MDDETFAALTRAEKDALIAQARAPMARRRMDLARALLSLEQNEPAKFAEWKRRSAALYLEFPDETPARRSLAWDIACDILGIDRTLVETE